MTQMIQKTMRVPDPTLFEAFEALIVLRSYLDCRHSQCNKELEAVEEALMNNLFQKTQSSIADSFKNCFLMLFKFSYAFSKHVFIPTTRGPKWH